MMKVSSREMRDPSPGRINHLLSVLLHYCCAKLIMSALSDVPRAGPVRVPRIF